jgi:uncharacterized RDD family membrane protein YckC
MSPQSKSPAPGSGLPAGVEAGPLGKRFLAYLIDLVVPAAIVLVSLALIRRSSDLTVAATIYYVGLTLCLVWFVIVWWLLATRAAGPGMQLMKLQLVGLRNGRPIGWGRVLVRALILTVLTGTVIGLIILLVVMVRNPRRQGLHDQAADAVVIKRRPLAPRRRAVATSAGRPATAPQSAPLPPPKKLVAPAGEPPASAGSAVPEDGRAPVPTSAGSHVLDGQPPSTDSVRVSRRVAAGPAQQEPPPLPVPDDGRPLDQGWMAVLDDGREVWVSGLVLLGRNPQARPGEEDAELVKVADETRTVSKTHLSLNVDASGLFVMDRGSTNGTTLTSPQGVSRPCPAGDVVPVNGGIVSFGDHWLRIERRRSDGTAEG